MDDIRNVISGYRDDQGVRHFSNTGAPEGAKVDFLEPAAQTRPGDENALLLRQAMDYDPSTAAMRDFARQKDVIFRHTFGDSVSDPSMLDARQQAIWQKNANKLYALLYNQHQQRKTALLQKLEKMEGLRLEEAGGRAKAAETQRKDAEEARKPANRLTAALERLQFLQGVLADPNTDAPRKNQAAAEYAATRQWAKVLHDLVNPPKEMTTDQLDYAMAAANEQWAALSPEERKAEWNDDHNAYVREALRQTADIIRGGSPVDRFPELGAVGMAAQPASGGQNQSADVQQRVMEAADVLRRMPEAQRQQAAKVIDAAALKAKQTGDPTELIRVLEQVKQTPVQSAGLNIADVMADPRAGQPSLERSMLNLGDAVDEGLRGTAVDPKRWRRGANPTQGSYPIQRGQRG